MKATMRDTSSPAVKTLAVAGHRLLLAVGGLALFVVAYPADNGLLIAFVPVAIVLPLVLVASRSWAARAQSRGIRAPPPPAASRSSLASRAGRATSGCLRRYSAPRLRRELSSRAGSRCPPPCST